MIHRIAVIAMVLLAAWTTITCVRIELLNAKAGYYLPRQDLSPSEDGRGGTWRVSVNNTPRDQLRGLVEGPGLLQYLLASLEIGLALFILLRKPSARTNCLAFATFCIGAITFGLAIYRGYYASLGD